MISKIPKKIEIRFCFYLSLAESKKLNSNQTSKMPATYVFKNESSIKYTGKGAKCGALHQAHIQDVLKASGGLTRAALKAKLLSEADKSWIGVAIAPINDIVDAQLTKLVKNGALEAVKPGVAQLKMRALAVGGDHAAAKALIKAEQKKAAAVKAKEYYLKQKAANYELKAKAEDLQVLLDAALQEKDELKEALKAKAEQNDELKAHIAAQGVLLEKAVYDLMEASAEVKEAKGELGLAEAQLQDAKAELQDAKADLAFVEADLMYQKVEVGMLADELKDEQQHSASADSEAKYLNTELSSLRWILASQLVAAIGAGIYFLANYSPSQQLQIGY